MPTTARTRRWMAVPIVAAAASLALALLVPTASWIGWFAHPVRVERGGGVPATTVEGAVLLRWMLVVLAGALLAAIPGLRPAQPERPAPSESPSTGRERLLVFLLTLLAVAVRLPRLAESLWYDELSALLDFAVHGPGPIVANYFVQSNHVLHTLLSWASIELFGVNEATLRLPALLASVAAVPATWCLVRASKPARPVLALVAAGAMALMPVAVLEGVEARGYSMMILFAALATWLFLRGWRSGSPLVWLAYAAIVALGMWSHLVTVCVAFGHAAMVVAGTAATRRWRAALGAGTALVLAAVLTLTLLSPLLPDLLRIRSEFLVQEGNEPTLFGPEGLHAVLQMGGSWAYWAAVPGLVLLLVGAAAAWRDRELRWAAGAALAGVPMAVVLAAAGGSWLYARFVLFGLPGAALLLAVGLLRLPRRWALAFGAVVAIGWAGDLAVRPPKQPLRDAVLEVAAKRRPDERVGAVGLIDNVIGYYGGAANIDIEPSGVGGRSLETMLAAHDPDWIILYYPATVAPDRYDLLAARGFRLESRHRGWVDWTNGDVLVYHRRR